MTVDATTLSGIISYKLKTGEVLRLFMSEGDPRAHSVFKDQDCIAENVGLEDACMHMLEIIDKER